MYVFQDIDRKQVEGELSELRAEHSKAQKDLEEFAQQVQQLKDQNSLLKAQRGNHGKFMYTVYTPVYHYALRQSFMPRSSLDKCHGKLQ